MVSAQHKERRSKSGMTASAIITPKGEFATVKSVKAEKLLATAKSELASEIGEQMDDLFRVVDQLEITSKELTDKLFPVLSKAPDDGGLTAAVLGYTMTTPLGMTLFQATARLRGIVNSLTDVRGRIEL